jgi:hypothetical protein
MVREERSKDGVLTMWGYDQDNDMSFLEVVEELVLSENIWLYGTKVSHNICSFHAYTKSSRTPAEALATDDLGMLVTIEEMCLLWANHGIPQKHIDALRNGKEW